MVTDCPSVSVAAPTEAVNVTVPADMAVNTAVYVPSPLSVTAPNVPVPVLSPVNPNDAPVSPETGFPYMSTAVRVTVTVSPTFTPPPSTDDASHELATGAAMVTDCPSVSVTAPTEAVNVTVPADMAVNTAVYVPSPLSVTAPNVPVPVLSPVSPNDTPVNPGTGFPSASTAVRVTATASPTFTLPPSTCDATDEFATDPADPDPLPLMLPLPDPLSEPIPLPDPDPLPLSDPDPDPLIDPLPDPLELPSPDPTARSKVWVAWSVVPSA